jgi:hypothetical protein
MLAISIELHRDIVGVPLRKTIPCLDSSADAKIERQIQDLYTQIVCDPGRSITGPVVNNQHIRLGRL